MKKIDIVKQRHVKRNKIIKIFIVILFENH